MVFTTLRHIGLWKKKWTSKMVLKLRWLLWRGTIFGCICNRRLITFNMLQLIDRHMSNMNNYAHTCHACWSKLNDVSKSVDMSCWWNIEALKSCLDSELSSAAFELLQHARFDTVTRTGARRVFTGSLYGFIAPHIRKSKQETNAPNSIPDTSGKMQTAFGLGSAFRKNPAVQKHTRGMRFFCA